MVYSFACIDHIQLAAPPGGEDKARLFYKGILGFEEIAKPALLQQNGGVWFKSSTIEIHIGIEEAFQPARKAHPAFRVNDITAFKQHIQQQNIKVKEDDRLPGATRFYMEDPFGNRLEFLEWENK